MNPEILQHPNIPKPLHGMAPRVLKGDDWWNETRQKAYASTNYHCYACGVHKSKAKKHQWLEAHEAWDINYQTGVCEVKSIVPLCHFCHNFIHSGKLYMDAGNKRPIAEARRILEHGFRILRNNSLRCFPSTLEIAKILQAKTYGVLPYEIKENFDLEWKDYVLKLDGEIWYSWFEDIEEWKEFYNQK